VDLSQPAAFPFPAHPRTPYLPLVINVALTGMVLDRGRAPHLPLRADEIAADAELCVAAGATILHLHARDAAGAPEWRRDVYARLVTAVRERCPDCVLCVSTSGRAHPELAQRGDVLSLRGDDRPDMASLTLGSLNFAQGPSVNAPAMIEALAAQMQEAGITPELELFDLGMAHLAHRLQQRGLIGARPYANLMLGFPNTAPADARSLTALIDALPAGTTWAAAGLGAYQRPANALAIAIGGHVRTGLEDNPDLDDVTRVPATNRELVERAVALATAAGRTIATAAQTRALLGLPIAVSG